MAASRTPRPKRAERLTTLQSPNPVGSTPAGGEPGLQVAAVQPLPTALSLDHFSPALPMAVALSGGADSMALLLACCLRWPGQVRAVHVHHGLQAAADAFAQHCEQWCQHWGVPLVVVRVDARAAPGQSPEEAARGARYQAIAQTVTHHWPEVRDVALAQHADDQVETLLLALSRGAGLPGLSAMPARLERHGLIFHRPWLEVPGVALREWLTACDVRWIEDPTNADVRYTRNRIRREVMPALQACFPTIRQTTARSARHAAQAQELLGELARLDAQATGLPPRLTALQQLSAARMANLLRYWLGTLEDPAARPSTAQLDQLVHQVQACITRGHRIDLRVGAGTVKREGDSLGWYNP
jgi:tRNA(Ile)-lysidine synthase